MKCSGSLYDEQERTDTTSILLTPLLLPETHDMDVQTSCMIH